MGAGGLQLKICSNEDAASKRENSGRKELLDKDMENRMIERVQFDRWVTATDLTCDEKLNEVEASIRKIKPTLKEADL